jgi:hypothetical protein
MTHAEATEIVATFMEPKPLIIAGERHRFSWWVRNCENSGPKFIPNGVFLSSLDSLREVEARLTDRQWERYVDLCCVRGQDRRSLRRMVDQREFDYADARSLLNASAEEKLLALAKIVAIPCGLCGHSHPFGECREAAPNPQFICHCPGKCLHGKHPAYCQECD